MEPLSLPTVQPSVDSQAGIRGGTGVVLGSGEGVVSKIVELDSKSSALEITKVLAELLVGLQVPEDCLSLVPVLSVDLIPERKLRVFSRRKVQLHMTMPRCAFDGVQMLNQSPKFELPPEVVAGMVWGVCDSLCGLRRILGPECSHGDIKLDNVMARPSERGGFRSCLIDYGHCKSAMFRSSRSRLAYWSPVERYECGLRSDMWSVGILAICLVSSSLRTYLQSGGLAAHRAVAVVSELSGVPAPTHQHLPERQVRIARGGARLRGAHKAVLGRACEKARRRLRRCKGLYEVVLRCLSWNPSHRLDPDLVSSALQQWKVIPRETLNDTMRALLRKCPDTESAQAKPGDDIGFSTMSTRQTRRTIKKIRNVVLGTPCEDTGGHDLNGWVGQIARAGRDTLNSCLVQK